MSCSKMLRPGALLASRGLSRSTRNGRCPMMAAALDHFLSSGNMRFRPFSTDSASSSGEKLAFKAETKKLLNIVAKSLYTDSEVFIRELISNASDACEKLRFMQASGKLEGEGEKSGEIAASPSASNLKIHLAADESARTFTIQDFGIGMTREELINNLGTICRSGSLEFMEKQAEENKGGNSTVIGQFGVGFYSAFVVADKIEVVTKSAAAGASGGFKWESDGMGEFTVSEVPESEFEGVSSGTKITLHLKEEHAEFAKLATVKSCAKKFSSFVDFPIFIAEGTENSFKELNKQEPLWLKSSATEEEHVDFFRYLNGTSYGDPFYTLSFSSDVPLTIKSLFYVPEDAPSRFFSKEPEIGVSLHCRRVLVKKNADGIIPGWLHWLKGVVDCEDMPLNVSRESMQDSRLMQKLSLAVVRRFLRFLDQQAKKDSEKYLKFYKNYSYYLKCGLIEDRNTGGRHKDELTKLLRFDCTTLPDTEVGKRLISFQEYVDEFMVSNKETGSKQKQIYYYCCPNRATAMESPYLEQLIARKRPVLLFYDDIDEFVISSALEGYKEYPLVAVDAQGKDFELELDAPASASSEENGANPSAAADKTPLTEAQKQELEVWLKSSEVLGSRVMEVKWTDRLISSPAVVTSVMTPHMRKLMKQMMAAQGGNAGAAGSETGTTDLPLTLELSDSHPIVKTLYSIKDNKNPEVARLAAQLLLDNASIAGGAVEEPRSVLPRLSKLLEVLVFQSAGFDYSEGKYKADVSKPAAAAEEKSESESEPNPAAYGDPEERIQEVKKAAM